MNNQFCSILNKEEFASLLVGAKLSQYMRSTVYTEVVPSEEQARQRLEELNVSDQLFCSFCSIPFLDQHNQRQHYRLDWHRYNLKLRLRQKKPVTEEQFSHLTDVDDVSSISGSESESETDMTAEPEDKRDSSATRERLSHLVARRATVLYDNAQGQIISIYRCLLVGKKDEVPNDRELLRLMQTLPERTKWLILMLGGGHFAAAIFNGADVVVHKTFHSYTVRAKQGSSQGAKDGQGGYAKSAGASLRRYNEAKLLQHVQDVLSSWADDVAACHLIFYRAVGPGNRGVLFGGRSPPLDKADPRLRTLPFSTRRATFAEIRRVHDLLATVSVYDSDAELRNTLLPTKVKTASVLSEPDKSESPRSSLIRAKERSLTVTELPCYEAMPEPDSSTGSEAEYVEPLAYDDQEIFFGDSLKAFEDTVPRSLKKKPRKKRKEKDASTKETSTEVQRIEQQLERGCAEGSTVMVGAALAAGLQQLTGDQLTGLLNRRDQEGVTLLHTAAGQAKGELVRMLLEAGADPCLKEKTTQTPYDYAPDKETRNVFRRFMGEHPDQHNYSKSHIPSALTDEKEQEMAERRRTAKRAKRQKEKERKLADEPRRREEEEQKRYLQLSDREKRALAAERRLLANAGKAGLVLVRCYTCAVDMTGKVPFEYSSFRFCSMQCLKQHRISTKAQLSVV